MQRHSHPISRHHALLAGVSVSLFGICMLVSRVQHYVHWAPNESTTLVFDLFGSLSSVAAGAALVADVRATQSRLRLWSAGGLVAVSLLPARWLWIQIPIILERDSLVSDLVSELSFGGFIYSGALICAILLLMLIWRTRDSAWTRESR